MVWVGEQEGSECILIRGEDIDGIMDDRLVLFDLKCWVRGIEAELEHGGGELFSFFAEGQKELNILLDITNNIGNGKKLLHSQIGLVKLWMELSTNLVMVGEPTW